MTAHARVGGAFKDVDQIHCKVGGSWKEVTEGYTKVGGVWKEFYTSSSAWISSATPRVVEVAGNSALTIPTVSDGELGIFVAGNFNEDELPVSMSGWTDLVEVNTRGFYNTDAYLAYKTMSSSDTGTTLDPLTGNDRFYLLFIFETDLGVADPSVPTIETTTGAADPITIPASAGAVPVLAVGVKWAAREGGSVTINGDTPDYDSGAIFGDQYGGSDSPAMRLVTKLYTSSPSDFQITTVDDGFGQAFAGFYFEQPA